jgi:choline dehydrogenase-like flavoprotein
VLTGGERRALSAVVDALLPSLDPRPGNDDALFRLSAADVGVAGAVETTIGLLSARQRGELRLFLRLVESRAFMFVASGMPSPMSGMSLVQRERALLRMSVHPLAPVRSGYQALRRLATFLFYSASNEGRHNPTLARIRYAVPAAPAPGAGGASLPVKRITSATTLAADVCVIGSGAGGGVAAARLAGTGKTVIVLEAGSPDQAANYDWREVAGMERLYLDRGTTTTRDASVTILAGSTIGGGTAVNWQTSLRTPDHVRSEWAERSGIRAFTEDAFTRATDAVCARLSVGTTESGHNANNAALARGCTALGYEWKDSPRNARGCHSHECGFCVFGCRTGGKQSTANTFLRDAVATGRVTIVAPCRAERVLMERGEVVGVNARALDSVTGQYHDVRVNARRVVVAAGAIESPALLLRSGIQHRELGRNLYLHPTTAVAGVYDEPIRGWEGAPQTVVCTAFSRLAGNFGYHLEAAPIHPGLIALAQPWFGARDHRERMQRAAEVSAFIVLARDQASGRVRVDREGRAMIDYPLGRSERALLQHGIATAARVHWAAGAAELLTLHTRNHTLLRGGPASIDGFCAAIERLPVHGNRCGIFSAHQMGTCRMGSDPRAAVCDERGRVYGIRGLSVCDASVFPASSGVNPMITIMALAYMVTGD